MTCNGLFIQAVGVAFCRSPHYSLPSRTCLKPKAAESPAFVSVLGQCWHLQESLLTLFGGVPTKPTEHFLPSRPPGETYAAYFVIGGYGQRQGQNRPSASPPWLCDSLSEPQFLLYKVNNTVPRSQGSCEVRKCGHELSETRSDPRSGLHVV